MLFSSVLTGLLWWGSPAGEARARFTTLREWALTGLSGLFLAVHFACWMASLKLTTVAASVVLVNTMPLFAALGATLFLKEPVRGRQWLGIALAVAGVLLISLESPQLVAKEHQAVGNLLALVGAASGAGYYVIGRSLRRKASLWAYVTPVYSVSALSLGVFAVLGSVALAPFPWTDWLIFALLAVVPGLLGHTLLNWSLRWLSAPLVNVIALGEPVVAAILAAVIPQIAELPGPWTMTGSAVIITGIAVVVTGHTR
jgi:drug/metabolite transporter (DMT)-like permease